MSPDRLSKVLEREPLEIQELKGNVWVYYYQINLGYGHGPANYGTLGQSESVLAIPFLLVLSGVYYGVTKIDVEAHRTEQIGLLQVYFEDNHLTWAGRFNPTTSDPQAGKQRMAKVAEAYSRLSEEEARGEAAYELALHATPVAIRDYWWCKSAGSGYALGQNAVERYELNCSPQATTERTSDPLVSPRCSECLSLVG